LPIEESTRGVVRAVVAVPPVRDFYRTKHRHSALGPRIVYRILKDAGWDASFFNFPILAKKGKYHSLPPDMQYLSPFIIPEEKGPISFFTRFQHFGPEFETCRDLILQSDPHIVFLSCFAFCYAEETSDLAETIAHMRPDILIAVGGAGVSVHPEYFQKNPSVSLVFPGEIEDSLPRFIQQYQPGACLGTPYMNPQPPENIIPAWALTGETGHVSDFAVSITRGCPKSCRFCSVHLSQGRRFRKASLQSVEEMIAGMSTIKKIRCNFEDDNLLCNPDYFLAVLERFSTRFPGIVFTAENGLDYSMLTPSLLEKLIRFGFSQFNLSIASVSPGILSRQNRPGDFTRYEELLAVLEKQAIPSITYFICGLPEDNPAVTAEALLYLADKTTKIGISLFYPVPGMKDFADHTLFNSISPRLTASSSVFPWNQSLSTSQMVTAFRLARFINMLKYSGASTTETLLKETIFSTRRLHTLIREKGEMDTIIPVENMDQDLVNRVLGGLQQNS